MRRGGSFATPSRWFGAALAAFGAMLLAGNVSGCTFLLKTDAYQCRTNADCTNRGPAFQGTTCGASNTCIPIQGYCATNQDCITRTGQDAYICQNNGCVGLLSPECANLMYDKGDTANDDVVVVGTLSMTNWGSPLLHAMWDAMALARTDFATATGGLPPPPGKKRRPIVVVQCDIPISKQQNYQPAIDHLINLKVPVLLGILTPTFVQYALQQGGAAGILNLTIASEKTTAVPGLFFTTETPSNDLAEVLLVNIFENKLLAAGIKPPLKVAYFATGTPTDALLSQSLYSNLMFNGKSAIANGSNFQEFDFGDFSMGGDPSQSQQVATAVTNAAAFKPDIAICFIPGCNIVTQELEMAGVHPDWVQSDGVAGDPSYAAFFDTMPNGMTRLLATKPGRKLADPNVFAFLQRFTGTYMDDAIQPDAAPNMFEIYYYMAYAMAALDPSKPITGTALGQVILNRFTAGGVPVSTDSTSIVSAFRALQGGGNVYITGLESNGVWQPNGTLSDWLEDVWCFNPVTTATDRVQDSGLTFRSSQPTMLQGALTCF